MLIALFIAFVWALACLCYDAYETNRGIKAGVALEGNWLISAIWGKKPKFWQLLSVDVPIRLGLAALALIPSPMYPHAMTACAVGALTFAGVKNIQGARQWLWMFKNPGKTLPLMGSAWKQFIGFWG